MEKLLFQKERDEARSSILKDFKSLFVTFRYAPLHKERFKNSKLYLGLKIKCKFETGLRTKKCKLKSGRDKMPTLRCQAHCQVAQKPTAKKAKTCQRAHQPCRTEKMNPSCQHALILHAAIDCKYINYVP